MPREALPAVQGAPGHIRYAGHKEVRKLGARVLHGRSSREPAQRSGIVAGGAGADEASG